ncbi:hypothetical protein BH10BAC2_BH10BAC2_10210 [soil metagenome]
MSNKKRNTARLSIIVIFLALIRCIAEIFRLHYYAATEIDYQVILPFLLGALVTAIACLLMFILSLFSRYTLIIVIAALTILALLYLKFSFAIQ